MSVEPQVARTAHGGRASTEQAATRRRAALCLLLVLLVAVAVRFAAFFAFADLEGTHGDETYYVARARSLLASGRYAGGLRPPGQSSVIAASFALFGDELASARLVQVALSLVTVALVFDVVRRRVGVAAATASGLLCAVHPTLVHYAHLLWSENLYALLLVLTIWALERAERSGAVRWAVLAGCALGLAALTRESALYLLPIAAVWLVARRGREVALAARARAAVLLAVATLAVVAPWIARNVARYDMAVLATGRWRILAHGNLDEQTVRRLRPRAGEAYLYRGIRSSRERERIARDLVLGAIAERQPRWIFEKAVESTRDLLGTRSQLERFVKRRWLREGVRDAARVVVALERGLLVLVVACGVAGLWLAPLGRLRSLVASVVLLHWAIYVVALAHHRMLVPLLPSLAIAAGPLVTSTHPWRDARPWRLAGTVLTLLALGLPFVP